MNQCKCMIFHLNYCQHSSKIYSAAWLVPCLRICQSSECSKTERRRISCAVYHWPFTRICLLWILWPIKSMLITLYLHSTPHLLWDSPILNVNQNLYNVCFLHTVRKQVSWEPKTHMHTDKNQCRTSWIWTCDPIGQGIAAKLRALKFANNFFAKQKSTFPIRKYVQCVPKDWPMSMSFQLHMKQT